MEGSTWGGRHVQWAGSTYWAGANGQARWANGQAVVREWRGWANHGHAGEGRGSVCESDVRRWWMGVVGPRGAASL